MPRVVPSQVVEVIDQLFPNAATVPHISVHVGATANLQAILSLSQQLPAELLTLTGQDLSDYFVSLAMIERVQQLWIGGSGQSRLSEHRGASPIFLLRQALSKCPDEAPAAGTTELAFVNDPDLRENIRRDISAASQDLANGEWKGATVLAGSATEALLLWAVHEAEKKQTGAISAATGALVSAGTLAAKPNPDPDRWNLLEMIEVALNLKLITQETATQARLGKDFRNLIHPGRAARLKQVCDRATALSALAAVEHVARDLS